MSGVIPAGSGQVNGAMAVMTNASKIKDLSATSEDLHDVMHLRLLSKPSAGPR